MKACISLYMSQTDCRQTLYALMITGANGAVMSSSVYDAFIVPQYVQGGGWHAEDSQVLPESA